jgi:hypothetical protein
MREAERIREILSKLPPDQRLFRINSGMAWTGKVVRREPGMIILENPRPFHGAPQGFPDLCGWTVKEITPDMVGQRIAVFTAVEVKVTGKLTKAQEAFKRVLEAMGGLFRVER